MANEERGQIFEFDKLVEIGKLRPITRPLRLQFPDGYYHVMSRGNRGEAIFITDSDRTTFLDGLADSCEIYGVKLIGYVLMLNHFHLSRRKLVRSLGSITAPSARAGPV
jgi:hypothetical protein